MGYVGSNLLASVPIVDSLTGSHLNLAGTGAERAGLRFRIAIYFLALFLVIFQMAIEHSDCILGPGAVRPIWSSVVETLTNGIDFIDSCGHFKILVHVTASREWVPCATLVEDGNQ